MTNIDGHSKPKPGGIRKSQIHLGPRINVPHYLYTLRGIQSAENNIQFGIDCPFALFSQPVCAISRSQITEATMDAEKLEPETSLAFALCSQAGDSGELRRTYQSSTFSVVGAVGAVRELLLQLSSWLAPSGPVPPRAVSICCIGIPW